MVLRCYDELVLVPTVLKFIFDKAHGYNTIKRFTKILIEMFKMEGFISNFFIVTIVRQNMERRLFLPKKE